MTDRGMIGRGRTGRYRTGSGWVGSGRAWQLQGGAGQSRAQQVMVRCRSSVAEVEKGVREEGEDIDLDSGEGNRH